MRERLKTVAAALDKANRCSATDGFQLGRTKLVDALQQNPDTAGGGAITVTCGRRDEEIAEMRSQIFRRERNPGHNHGIVTQATFQTMYYFLRGGLFPSP